MALLERDACRGQGSTEQGRYIPIFPGTECSECGSGYGCDNGVNMPQRCALLCRWAREHGLVFVPSIGPGYNGESLVSYSCSTVRTQQRVWDSAISYSSLCPE